MRNGLGSCAWNLFISYGLEVPPPLKHPQLEDSLRTHTYTVCRAVVRVSWGEAGGKGSPVRQKHGGLVAIERHLLVRRPQAARARHRCAVAPAKHAPWPELCE
jgi:hypothetical protein